MRRHIEVFPSVDQDYRDGEFRLWVLLRQVAHTTLVARDRELNQYGITTIQAAVLHTIQLIGNKATPAEIARRILRERHSVSGLLIRMEKDGLVRKVKDLDRKNLIRVAITEKGQQAYDQSTKRKSIHKIMSSLSEEERQQQRSCLEKLGNKALRELLVNRKPPFPQF